MKYFTELVDLNFKIQKSMGITLIDPVDYLNILDKDRIELSNLLTDKLLMNGVSLSKSLVDVINKYSSIISTQNNPDIISRLFLKNSNMDTILYYDYNINDNKKGDLSLMIYDNKTGYYFYGYIYSGMNDKEIKEKLRQDLEKNYNNIKFWGDWRCDMTNNKIIYYWIPEDIKEKKCFILDNKQDFNTVWKFIRDNIPSKEENLAEEKRKERTKTIDKII